SLNRKSKIPNRKSLNGRRLKKRALLTSRFAVNELPQPHLEVDERPESLRMILRARLVARDHFAHEHRVEESARRRALAEDVFVNYVPEATAKPRAHGDGEAHLRTPENLFGEHALHRAAQNVFRR